MLSAGKRKNLKFHTDKNTKKNILFSLKNEKHIAFYDNNNFQNKLLPTKYELIAGFGKIDELNANQNNFFTDLDGFISNANDTVFGFLSYDLKNNIENLSSENPDKIKFPLAYFFRPEIIVTIKNNQCEILYYPEISSEKKINLLEADFRQKSPKPHRHSPTLPLNIKQKISEKEYLNSVESIKKHIKRGDIYEANYCFEFYAKNTEISPFEIFDKLNKKSPAPFSAFFRYKDKYLMSSSPERFLTRNEKTIYSQPIKGTGKRSKNPQKDEFYEKALENDSKERAENIMIVDLTRNDLSRIAKKNSVKVPELCKVYKFRQVHQMISTVKAEISDKINFSDIIKAAFPPGSMTGAPKIRAMKIIEKYEKSKRGLYAGSVGYIEANKNFDFNVIIRSILYNQTNKYVSFQAGSAITANSDPEKEYKECLLKAKAMKETLEM